jgi:hypothetical protein
MQQGDPAFQFAVHDGYFAGLEGAFQAQEQASMIGLIALTGIAARNGILDDQGSSSVSQ